MRRLLFTFGTRPEFIKLYPIIVEARQRGFDVSLVSTGQHEQMLDQLLDHFNVSVDQNLRVMADSRGLAQILANTLVRLDEVMATLEPDLLFTHGDTSATLAGSLIALYHQVPLAHVEAGLRTHNKYSPFPEEMNRQLAGVLADEHFAPTEVSRSNLLAEGRNPDRIHVVGNSAIDMLRFTIRAEYSSPLLEEIGPRPIILVTVHRRENLGLLRQMFNALNALAATFTDHVMLFPVHLNPVVRTAAADCLTARNVMLIDPLDTVDFHNVMSRSELVLTDSGGIQEEAPSLGKPVLVLRDTTERPEGLAAGTLRLVGTDADTIVSEATALLTDRKAYQAMARVQNPYGDGSTASRIIDIISDDGFWNRLPRP